MSNKTAIIGMDTIFGSCQGLENLNRSIYEGNQYFIPLPNDRYKSSKSLEKLPQEIILGAYLRSFEIDVFYWKIPPCDLEKIDPQALLILKVIDGALKEVDSISKKVAIIIIGSEIANQKIQQFIITKLTKIYQFNCYVKELNSCYQALEKAQELLKQKEVDIVVLVACNLIEEIKIIPKNSDNIPTLSYDEKAKSTLPGEGAGAMVLQSYEIAKTNQTRIYAVIDGIAGQNISRTNPESATIKEVCQAAFQSANIQPNDIACLEVVTSGIEEKDRAEIEGLIQAYQESNSDLNCAITSITANIGYTNHIAGIASLIKTALCLYHRYIPATPNWSKPKQPEIWQNSPFYSINDSKPWFLEKGQNKRIATVNLVEKDGTYGHFILSEDLTKPERVNHNLKRASFCLFPIAGKDQTDIETQLDILEQRLEENLSLPQLASQIFVHFNQIFDPPYVLTIIAPNPEKLRQEIQQSRKGIKQSFSKNKPWKSPLGSYFTPTPLGQQGKIAFVYPGAFNSYLGMGRSLFNLFPKLSDYCETLSSCPSEFFREKQLYPRSLHRLSKRELEDLEMKLMQTPLAMLETGTGFAVLFTQIMREYFQVHPQLAFGYSMGESTMMYALGVWENTDYGSQFIHSSDLFHNRLAGLRKAVLDYWEISPSYPPQNLWKSYVLMASEERVKQYIKPESRVYLTHVNTPNEVVIAGVLEECLQLIETINCDYFPSPSSFVLHCEAMASEYSKFRQLNNVPISNQPKIVFYSSASYAPILLNNEEIAHQLAQGVCQELDFPQLIHQVYKDGARIFIELGSGGTCTRWIDETLKQQDHAAMCISRRGSDDFASIIKVLAQLVSHKVLLNLLPIYAQKSTDLSSKKSLIKTVSLEKYPIKIKVENVIFDAQEILELTNDKVSHLLGKDFVIVDTYKRRVRMPSPPFLFVSRVTKLEGERGNYKTGFIQTEYDIPTDVWYLVDGQVPIGICSEAGHGLLLLLSYLGADFESQGKRSFRLLDITATFFDLQPETVKMLRYDVKITSHVQTTDSLLIFFTGECWIGDQLWMRLSNGCAGLFSDEELALGQGIVISEGKKEARKVIQKNSFRPLLNCEKIFFNQEDLLNLTQGNVAACFGKNYDQNGLNSSLKLPPQQLMMIDRVIAVDPQGGIVGKGLITASKFVKPDDWYFLCHFKNDPTMPGNLMLEGGIQLLQFYLLFLGLQTRSQNARFQPLCNRPQVTRFRGQVTPISGTLFYQLEVLEIGLTPNPYVLADVDIIFGDKTIATIKNLGLQLVEKHQTSLPEKLALFNSEKIQEISYGNVISCLGSDFQIYANRRCVRLPNREFCLVSRVLDIEGKRHEFQNNPTITTEYDVPRNAWFYQENSYPYLPYCTYIEIAGQPCIFLGVYLGTTLLFPDEDLYFRNLDGKGKILKDIDVRGKTITDKVRLVSSTAIKGAILQKFEFELSCEGENFYEGEMLFGFFSHQVLVNQVGLDGGKFRLPWYQTNQTDYLPQIKIDLQQPIIRQKFYQPQPNQSYYHLAQGKLDFLDDILIIESGGHYQKGYIYASKTITPEDWYFPYHFYQDPVMPGALGVESILQAMQVYALQLNLGKSFKSPRFGQVLNHQITWKYRGQITPDNKKMSLEIHISDIKIENNQITLIGDASLWKENLRIYEIKDIAICLMEWK